jgi:hypothetical protein
MKAGERWITRGGAVVEVVAVKNTGLTIMDMMGKPLREAKLVVCRFVAYAHGQPIRGDEPGQFAVHEDGYYLSNDDHALDLVAKVAEVMVA